MHKTIGPLFHPQMPAAAKDIHRQNLRRRLSHIDQRLAQQPYLTGGSFTVADAYLFVMIGWEPWFKVDLTPYPNLARFHGHVAARPSFAHLLRVVDPVLRRVKLPAFPGAAPGR